MKHLIIAALLTALAVTCHAKPLEYRVWQFQDYNMDHMKRLVDMASEHGVNRIQLSHHIIMYVEQLIREPERAEDFNEIIDLATEKGIKVDFWTHELEAVPERLMRDGKADLENPEFWGWMKDKYRKAFAMCPGMDGVVLTFHETGIKVFDDNRVISSLSPEARVTKLIDTLGEVCAELDKKLFVRTFVYEPEQLQFVQDGLSAAESDFIVMTKNVPHDWQPYYPNNPAIGAVGDIPQVVEFDLGHEFTGKSLIPYIMLDYLREHLDYGIAHNIDGAVLRIERKTWRATDTPNQDVISVFSDMLLDPSIDENAEYKKILVDRYGEKAAKPLYEAFIRTFDVVNKSYFVLGYWITNHSFLPDYNYAWRSIHGRTTAKWDPSTADVEKLLHIPTRKTVELIAAEKDEAIALADECLDYVEAARPHLSCEDYNYLRVLFERQKGMAVVWKPAMELIFNIAIYKESKSEEDKAYMLDSAERLEIAAADNSTHLVHLVLDYRTNFSTWMLDTVKGLVEKAKSSIDE